MFKALEITKADLGTIRTGRATPSLVDNVVIVAYSGSQKLKIREMVTISAPDVQSLILHPFDPSTKEDIVRGIFESNLGLNPIIDGEMIRISIPPLSQERREEFLKLAKAKLEAGKVMIRQIRHDEMSQLKREYDNKEITEDDKKRFEKQIQEVTDEMIAEMDHLEHLKERELMQI